MGRRIGGALARLLGAEQESDSGGQVAALAPDDAAAMRLPWESGFTPEGLRDHVLAHPGLAWRVAGADEYAVGGWWQGRRDIGLVREVVSGGHRAALVEALVDALRCYRACLAILSPEEETRSLSFYRDCGFEPLEEVYVYRREAAPPPKVEDGLTYSAMSEELLPGLLALEEAAFPWVWRYGADMFQEAEAGPAKRLRVALDDGRVAGYFCVTLHHDFGHLDRLAVHPSLQGRGYGAAMLARALGELAAMGGRVTGLSTQHDNTVSQRLYGEFGFRRTGKYRIHGKWLAEPPEAHLKGEAGEPGNGKT